MSGLVFRFATMNGQDVHWRLQRNCSVSPAQLWFFYLSLCTLSLGIAVFFWWQGAVMVLPFAALELLLLAAALLLYARHAADGERITLRGGRLVVELERAGQRQRAEFLPAWVRVEPHAGDGSLIEVSGQGRKVCVGRFVRPELRPALAREIRAALRAA